MPDSAPPRRSLLPLIVALAALLLSTLLASAFPLLDPAEGRNAEIAREMAVDGDWLVPHLAGMPSLDRPPALAWAAAAAIRVAGNEPWAVRLPAALASALTLALLTRSAQRRGGRPFALRAAALLYTAPLFAVLSACAVTAVPLALCVTAVWLGLAAEVTGGPSARRRLGMFAAVAAGLLVNGPVMLAWALGGSLGAALICRRPAPLRWLAWWPGWLVVLGVAGGWLALASVRHPGVPGYAFLAEPSGWLTGDPIRGGRPWWLAPVALAAGALPWSLATPWWRRRAPGEEGLLSAESRVGLGFVSFAVACFPLWSSNAAGLLPALPMLAWTAAEAWSDAERARRAAWGLAVVFLAITLASAFAGFGPWLGRAGAPFDSAATSAKIIAACFAYVALRSAAAALGRPDRAFIGILLFTPVVLFAAGEPLLRYAETRSGEPLARAIATIAPGGFVRYEACYSPGADFRLGRRSALLSALGVETTSAYQARHRAALLARGLWTPLTAVPDSDRVDVVVRPARGALPPPEGYMEFFRDGRFAAYVRR